MDSKKQRIDNTIKIVAEVLERNKDKEKVKEIYKDIQSLKEKRDLN